MTCETCRPALFFNGYCTDPKACEFMPKQELTQDVALIPELDQGVYQLIAANLTTLQELSFEAKLLKEQVDLENKKIYKILKDEGVSKARIDAILLTEVKGETSTLDKLEFVRLGGDLKILELATRKKPKKPYLLVTFPGQKSQSRGEEEE